MINLIDRFGIWPLSFSQLHWACWDNIVSTGYYGLASGCARRRPRPPRPRPDTFSCLRNTAQTAWPIVLKFDMHIHGHKTSALAEIRTSSIIISAKEIMRSELNLFIYLFVTVCLCVCGQTFLGNLLDTDLWW